MSLKRGTRVSSPISAAILSNNKHVWRTSLWSNVMWARSHFLLFSLLIYEPSFVFSIVLVFMWTICYKPALLSYFPVSVAWVLGLILYFSQFPFKCPLPQSPWGTPCHHFEIIKCLFLPCFSFIVSLWFPFIS